MKNKIQNHFVPFDKTFYLQKEGEFQNDFLFKQATMELGLSPIFDYQMSFLKNQEKYYIFLTHIKNLNKNSFSYPQPLIFQALFYEKFIEQENFAVLVFDENFTFLCFYKKGKLNGVKNIPQFSLKDILEKNESQRKDLFSQILFEQGRVFELFKYNQSEILISFCDVFGFGEFLSQKTLKTHIKLENLIPENALENLSIFSHKYLDSNANFIKKEKSQMKFYIKSLISFLAFYLATLIFLTLSSYPQYKQNINTKQSNENLTNELLELDLKTKLLNEELEKLNATFKENSMTLQKNEEFLQNLSQNFYPDKNRILILVEMIEILNQNSIKISFLGLENKELKLIFNDKENLDKALNFFENQTRFKILQKNESNYHLILGYDNG